MLDTAARVVDAGTQPVPDGGDVARNGSAGIAMATTCNPLQELDRSELVPERVGRSGSIGRVAGRGVFDGGAHVVGNTVITQVRNRLVGDPQKPRTIRLDATVPA